MCFPSFLLLYTIHMNMNCKLRVLKVKNSISHLKRANLPWWSSTLWLRHQSLTINFKTSFTRPVTNNFSQFYCSFFCLTKMLEVLNWVSHKLKHLFLCSWNVPTDQIELFLDGDKKQTNILWLFPHFIKSLSHSLNLFNFMCLWCACQPKKHLCSEYTDTKCTRKADGYLSYDGRR